MLTKITKPAVLLGLFLIALPAGCQPGMGDNQIRPSGVFQGDPSSDPQVNPSENLKVQGVFLTDSTMTLGHIDSEDPRKNRKTKITLPITWQKTLKNLG